MTVNQIPLGEVATFIRGITFKPEDKIDANAPDAVVCMRTKNVQDLLDQDDLIAIPPSFVNRQEQYLDEGDILVSTANSWELVGKSCWVPKIKYRATAGGFISILRANREKAFPRYLYHWMNSSETLQKLRYCGRQTTNISNMSFELACALKLPLPPLPEQKRIAAILDKADSILRKRQEAVRLTEDLLRSAFLEMFGDPVMNPKGWDVKPLCELVNFTTGKLDSNAAVNGGAYPFFTCSRDDLQIDTFAFDCEALLLAGNNASADYSVKYYKGRFNAYQRTYIITMANQSLSYRYMQYALEMKLLDMKRLSKGTNTKYLTLGILDELLFQVPDNAAQSKFEKIIDKLNSTASKLKLAESVADSSFNSLLQSAFKGEL